MPIFVCYTNKLVNPAKKREVGSGLLHFFLYTRDLPNQMRIMSSLG